MQPQLDFISTNHGSIVSLQAITPAAADWLCAEIDPEENPGAPFAIEIDARYFMDIAMGILSDGLTLQDSDTGAFASAPVTGGDHA